MADEKDYSRKLEETLQEAGVMTRPRVGAVQAALQSGSRPLAPGKATFSSVMAGQMELQKRLEAVIAKAKEAEGLLTGEQEAMPSTGEQPLTDAGTPVFVQLATQTLVHAKELARLDRILDRVLGALR